MFSKSLNKKEERLDLLLNLKIIVNENVSEVSAEIKSLINREADMMNRGRPSANLVGVRERILKLFLYYIKNAEMNPEIGLLRMRRQKINKRLEQV